jgi:hypothetical protein
LRNEDELGGKKMNPTPEQISEWRKDAEKPYHNEYGIDNDARTKFAYTLGYIRARAEQDPEIASCKPITAEDVTDEMMTNFIRGHTDNMTYQKTFIAAVNAYMKGK